MTKRTRLFQCPDCGTQVDGTGTRRLTCVPCADKRQRMHTARWHAKNMTRAPSATTCPSCGVDVQQPEGRGKRVRYCRPCAERAILNRNLWRTHRMTLDRYEELVVAQGSKCANPGCTNTEPGGVTNGRWLIDHDHSCCPTGRSCGKCFRGLLCQGCNVAAGCLRDDPARIRGLADYLEAH